MSIGFHIVNEYFLHQMEEYIKRKAEAERENFSNVPDRILKASLAYQYLCIKANKGSSLKEILEKHSDLGLIGPGHGTITHILEKFFSSSQTFKKHAMLHDAFGNFFLDFGEGPGYCYASPIWLPSFMRDAPVMGQISGLLMCYGTNFSFE